MRSLVDFFNHGILPFTGRSPELDRLIEFWRGTAEAQGLRVALLLGEAGIGKSRLIEELIPRILAAGGVVAHTRLYPESATSVAPLVARALWGSAAGRQLLKKEPEGEMGSVSAALQRLSRLRPTLLIVEDVHLLAGEALRDFSLLLEGLAAEPISVICVARPVELGARGVLERYLVDEIDLGRLDIVALRQLWLALFESESDPALLDLLLEATRGNALALRSALRGILKSGALVHDPAGGTWHAATSLPLFEEALRRNVRLLSEGMAAHLADEERSGAERLAALGEVFSREAARALVPDADRLIETLTFKGVVADLPVPTTMMAGRYSSSPMLAFTHTLLHLHLVERSALPADALLRVIAEDLPLSSALPFRLLADRVGELSAPAATLRAAVERSLRAAAALDPTADWLLGVDALAVAERIVELHAVRWEPVEHLELQLRTLDCRLSLLRRRDHTTEYRGWAERYAEMTGGGLPESLLEYRLRALRYIYSARRRSDVPRCRAIWDEVDRLVEAHPELRLTRGYILFIQSGATSTGLTNDSELAHRAEDRLNELLATEGLTEELRTFALREVAPQFLWLFGTPEELATRFELLARIERISGRDDWMLHTRKMALLEGLGYAEEAIRLIDEVVPRLREKGLVRHAFQSAVIRVYAQAWLDVPLEDLAAQVEQMAEQAPPEIRRALRERAGVRLSRIGLLRGDPAFTRGIIDTMLPPNHAELRDAAEQVLLASAEGTLADELPEMLDGGRLESGLVPLARMTLGREAPREEVERGLRDALPAAIMTRNDLTTVYAAAALLDALPASKRERDFIETLRGMMREALRASAAWLIERKLDGYLAPLLRMHEAYFTSGELESMHAALERIADERRRRCADHRDPRLRVSILGTIEVQEPGREPVRLRGARLKTLLGLLVVDRMLDKPLSYREFCRLAASGEEDPERARKVMNMGVLRLREAIGGDAILTDAETPRLNLDRVHVDLLEAHELLRVAAAAAREGTLVKALPPLLRALKLSGGQVPFPALYDGIFEAAREDFELELRTASIDVARGLLREGDPAGAGEVLRPLFDAMPDDEEIAELLQAALIQLGRRAEAARVKMRVEEN